MAEYQFLKPLFTEIEKNNIFTIYTRSDLKKITEETIKKYDLIDGSNRALKQRTAVSSHYDLKKLILTIL